MAITLPMILPMDVETSLLYTTPMTTTHPTTHNHYPPPSPPPPPSILCRVRSALHLLSSPPPFSLTLLRFPGPQVWKKWQRWSRGGLPAVLQDASLGRRDGRRGDEDFTAATEKRRWGRGFSLPQSRDVSDKDVTASRRCN